MTFAFWTAAPPALCCARVPLMQESDKAFRLVSATFPLTLAPLRAGVWTQRSTGHARARLSLMAAAIQHRILFQIRPSERR
jgi:hypothetical protein